MGKKSRSRKNSLAMVAVAAAIALLLGLLYNEMSKPVEYRQKGVSGLASTDEEGYAYPDTVNVRKDGSYSYDTDAPDQFMLAWAEAMKNRDVGLYMTLLSKKSKSWLLLEALPELETLENAYAAYSANPSKYEQAVLQRVTDSMANIAVAGITSFKVLSMERIEADDADKAQGIEAYLSVVVLKEYNDGTGDEASVKLAIENGKLKL